MEVGIASHNIERRETYLRVLASLKSLESACDAAFDRIDAATSARFQALERVDTRVGALRTRIETLARSRRAVRIEASPSYPLSTSSSTHVQ